MNIDSRCLNAFGVPNAVANGIPFTLEFTLNPTSKILFPFFKKAFDLHDQYRRNYGLPVLVDNRFRVFPGDISARSYSDDVKYSITCTLEDFYRAFLGSYTPSEMADFLELHAVDFQEQLTMLARAVRSSQTNYKVVIPFHSQNGNSINNLRFVPVGFLLEEVLSGMSKRHLSKRTYSPGPYFINGFRDDVAVPDLFGKSPHFLVTHYNPIERFFAESDIPILIAPRIVKLPLDLGQLLGARELKLKDWFYGKEGDYITENEMRNRKIFYREVKGYHQIDFYVNYYLKKNSNDETRVQHGCGVLKAGRRLLSFEESHYGRIPFFITDVEITSLEKELHAVYRFVAGYKEDDIDNLFFPFYHLSDRRTLPQIVGIDTLNLLMEEIGFRNVSFSQEIREIKYNSYSRKVESTIIV